MAELTMAQKAAALMALLEELHTVTLPLNAMRCEVCGHRLDDMAGCDSCAADLEAFGWSDDPDDGGRR